MTSFLTRPFIPILFAGAFTVIGVLMLLTGGTQTQRQMGLGVVLFFGGALSGLIAFATRRPQPATRRIVTLPDGSSVEGLRLARRQIPRGFAIVAQLAAAGGSLVFLVTERTGRYGGPVITLALGAIMAVFIATAVVGIVRRAGPDDGIWFTIGGLLSRTSGSAALVPWTAVDRISLASPRQQPTMRLHLRDGSAVAKRNVNPLLDTAGRIRSGPSTYPVSLTSTVADPMAVVDLTTKLVEQAWNRGSDPAVLFDHPLAKGIPTISGAVRVA